MKTSAASRQEKRGRWAPWSWVGTTVTGAPPHGVCPFTGNYRQLAAHPYGVGHAKSGKLAGTGQNWPGLAGLVLWYSNR
jgi:hypothetical protein